VLVATVLAAMAMAALAAPPPAGAGAATRAMRPLSTTGIAGWRLAGHYTENSLLAGEGVATVAGPGSAAHELYRGSGSIPAALNAQGWTHIGDPDSYDGTVVDAYQGSGSGDTKMYLVTTPSGATYQYIHTLVPGELYNNSFVALSPGGQWMVSGTWGAMDHLEVYPAPFLNHETSPDGGPLDLAGSIRLDHEVYDVQGCAFTDATTLVCATTGERSLFANPLPLLEIELRQPLDGGSVAGHVVDLGSLPEQSACHGTFESEGVDYDTATGVLRAEVIQPGYCELATIVYEFTRTRH
jgi:hypothetical protein